MFARIYGHKSPSEWNSFAAGAIAGYLIMSYDNSYKVMKKQINMAIGIRTLYAFGAYLIRKNYVPFLEHTPQGYDKGTVMWYTLMWGVVMWHWRHQTAPAPGEMNKAQVKQMNFIYNDFSLAKGWTQGTYLYWLASLMAIKSFL